MHVEISEITTIPEQFVQQVRDLYERSFPAEERHDFDDIVRSIGDDGIGRARLILAHADGTVLGLNLFKYYVDAEFGYLWYLCVGESARGLGIGGKLYRETLKHLAEITRANGSRVKGLIFEVERLNTESHPIFGDPIRRVKFYERLGARMILGYDYRQPPIPPHPEVPLQLMFHPLDLPECECTETELARIIADFKSDRQAISTPIDPTGLRLRR